MRGDLRAVRLLASDVDGVWTRGDIVMDAEGRRLAVFSVRDGMGVTLAQRAGLEIALISGAASAAVRARAAAVGVVHVQESVTDKGAALRALCTALRLEREAVLYVGDDLNDLPAFHVAGVRVAVADAVPELRAAADWVTDRPGGAGAFREIVEAVLRARGEWERAVAGWCDVPERIGG
jgi:3-deoxy-D-manno-octulosonate 8-phosphate phosphatase (KDO 8-P phosphatase)